MIGAHTEKVRFMEIIVFAILAGYLFFRLWGVLGTRTGHERPFDSGKQDRFEGSTADNVIVMPKHAVKVPDEAITSEVDQQLFNLKKVAPDFNALAFKRAAENAFLMIIKAYSQGNLRILQGLLEESVYQQFSMALKEREEKRLTQQVEVDSLESELVSIEVSQGTIQITMRFKSDQMIATFDEKGENMDNPACLKVHIVDLWTFEKSIKTKSPTWLLIRTSAETLS